MLYGLSDVVQLRRMIDTGEGRGTYKRVARGKLDALLGLCETPTCRRGRLLNYFGEPQVVDYRCGNCDNCLSPPETWDASEPVRMALSAIYRTGQRYGAAYLIDILRGNANATVKERGHEGLSVFGIGRALTDREWRSLFRQLVALGWVEVDTEGYGTLRLTICRAAGPARGDARIAPADCGTPQVRSGQKPRADVEGLARHWRCSTAPKPGGAQRRRPTMCRLYVILHDQAACEIASGRPSSLAALGRISGIGENKLRRFGERLLALVNDA